MNRRVSLPTAPHTRRTFLKLSSAAGIAFAAKTLHAQDALPIDVAAVFSFSLNEPWVSRVHEALLNAQYQGKINYLFTQRAKGDAYIDALRGYAQRGVKLIVSENFENPEPIYTLAKSYPEISFLVGSTGRPQQPNLSVFDNHIHETTYLAGMIAGGMSASGIISLVAGHDVPKTNRLLHAFIDGAKEINPDATFLTTFINSWSDPTKAQHAALEHIKKGADIIYAERAGVEAIAQQHKKFVINNTISAHQQYPDTVLASAVWDASPIITRALLMVERGTFKADDYGKYSHIRYQGSMLSPKESFTRKIPQALLAHVNARYQTILDGSFTIKPNETPITYPA